MNLLCLFRFLVHVVFYQSACCQSHEYHENLTLPESVVTGNVKAQSCHTLQVLFDKILHSQGTSSIQESKAEVHQPKTCQQNQTIAVTAKSMIKQKGLLQVMVK